MADEALTGSSIEFPTTAYAPGTITIAPGSFLNAGTFVSTMGTDWMKGISFGTATKRRTFFGKKDTKYPDLQVRAFFKIVKAGLTQKEKKEYQKLAEEAFEQAVEYARLGQKNVAERFEKIMSLNLKKAAAQLKGYDLIIHKKMIEKYQDALPCRKELVIDDLEEYDKPLPRGAKIKLNKAKKESIFDSFCIFWIREVKDPILFGQFNEDPDVYYYVAEWDDDISIEDLLKYK
jgi:hypothetical protein